MRKIWLLSLLFVGVGLLLITFHRSPSLTSAPAPSTPTPTLSTEQPLQYKSYALPQSTIHTLTIPNSFLVIPAVAKQTETLEQFAQKYQAIAVLNGGFFDPENRQSTSYIVLQGKQLADPKQNDRLMTNPDLAPYLNKILDRSEFRRYQCTQEIRYAIARHNEAAPTGCQLVDALGAGPRLLPEMTLIQEGFLDIASGRTRDSLGYNQPNARTAIGITHDGSIVWVMAAQTAFNSGMTLPSLAAFMIKLGIETAINLDGGSSSSLYYNGRSINGKLNEAGQSVQRPVKSVLLIQAAKGI